MEGFSHKIAIFFPKNTCEWGTADFLRFCEKNLVFLEEACYNINKKFRYGRCGGKSITVDYTVEKRWEGDTVLSVIKKELGISGSVLRHLKFLERGILLNGERVTVRHPVHEGDVLSLCTEDEEPQEHLIPVPLPLGIAYEDDDVVVPDKPADMPTHPSHNHHEDTVANALAFRYREMGIPFVFRPINRLDRNTSGLLLIARNRLAAGALSAAMREHRIGKQYLAVLDGVPAENEGIIETYIRRTAESIIVRENCGEGEGGDRAVTHYRVLAAADGHALVLASPITGRTHQLRVHFAGIGCPITGDDMYGSPSPLIARHALHAYRLTFPRPSDGEAITVHAPLHEDMLSLVRLFFADDPLSQISTEGL